MHFEPLPPASRIALYIARNNRVRVVGVAFHWLAPLTAAAAFVAATIALIWRLTR